MVGVIGVHVRRIPMLKNKRFITAVLTVVLAATGLVGCGNTAQTHSDVDDGKVSVVASFYPMSDFAKRVGGDKVSVKCMVPAMQEPHVWEPTPQDIAQLSDADVFVYNGCGLEGWVDGVKDNLDPDKPVVVEASKGCHLLNSDHDHDHGDHHHEGGYDPHVWLSPANARIEMQNICDALVKVDPDNAEYYKKNMEEASIECDRLEREYKDTLDKCDRHEIVVSHEAFGYICHDFGLEQIGIEGIEPDGEPNPARMAEIVELTKSKGVTTIFTEAMVNPKVAHQIASETGCVVKELNPLEGLSEEDQKAGMDYFKVMRNNLEELKVALSD